MPSNVHPIDEPSSILESIRVTIRPSQVAGMTDVQVQTTADTFAARHNLPTELVLQLLKQKAEAA